MTAATLSAGTCHPQPRPRPAGPSVPCWVGRLRGTRETPSQSCCPQIQPLLGAGLLASQEPHTHSPLHADMSCDSVGSCSCGDLCLTPEPGRKGAMQCRVPGLGVPSPPLEISLKNSPGHEKHTQGGHHGIPPGTLHSHRQEGLQAQPGTSWGSEEAGGGLGRSIVIPDVLQDVHLVHGLDLLLLLRLPSHGFRRACFGGQCWFSGQCWLGCHWWLRLGLGLGLGLSPQVQNLVQILFHSEQLLGGSSGAWAGCRPSALMGSGQQ